MLQKIWEAVLTLRHAFDWKRRAAYAESLLLWYEWHLKEGNLLWTELGVGPSDLAGRCRDCQAPRVQSAPFCYHCGRQHECCELCGADVRQRGCRVCEEAAANA